MQKLKLKINGSKVNFLFDANAGVLNEISPADNIVYVTDENVARLQAGWFKQKNVVIVPAGEANKQQQTVDHVLQQLLHLNASRDSLIVGVGGGVVTDMVGYASSVFMRGVRFGFFPTTVLAMVDAAIGGKNGVDLGIYKNLVGTITQPEFIAYDFSLLKTLPQQEWTNGMAEVIKHACIADSRMFKKLTNKGVGHFLGNEAAFKKLVLQNAMLKTQIVQADPLENGERRKLNFGHTLGHAIENDLGLMHGHAISIGMAYAALLSEEINGFKHAGEVIELLRAYQLPVNAGIELSVAVQRMTHDKKRSGDSIRYVLLNKIGDAVVHQIAITNLLPLLQRAQSKLNSYAP